MPPACFKPVEETPKELSAWGVEQLDVFRLNKLNRYDPNCENLQIGSFLSQPKPKKADLKRIELAKARFVKMQECAAVSSTDLMAVMPREVEMRLARDIENSDADFVISVCKGNEYCRFCLVNFPQPIQISTQSSGISDENDTIPDEIIRSNLKYLSWNFGSMLYFQALCNATEKPVVMLPPPPPIGDDEHLMTYPGSFKDKMDEFGPAAKELRRRTYEIYRDVLREGAADVGGRFMDLPDDIAEDGFLKPEYYSVDPIHGNSAYGLRILEHVADQLNKVRN